VPPPFLGFSLQRLPLAEIACPSRGRFAPLQLSTAVLERRLLVLITAGFFDARARAQLPDSPDDYELPFVEPEGSLPGCSGAKRRNSFRSASFTCFEALILLRVRSHRPELPRAGGRSSPGFSPL